MTPYEKNFKVPGRFEDHECTFITWPSKDSDLEIFNYENEIVIFAENSTCLPIPSPLNSVVGPT